jgi:hypothetical protein
VPAQLFPPPFLKLLERQTELQVPQMLPPTDLEYIRFHRLEAEAELLRLTAGNPAGT